ncbi:MAG: four helix bundle protein [Bacteroidota bacterium]
MNNEGLKPRTRRFGIKVIEFVGLFPRNIVGKTIGTQLLRSGTSVGANYRSACRARSRADFISKIQIAEEESDECEYWLDLATSANLGDHRMRDWLAREAGELTAILAQSAITAKHGEQRDHRRRSRQTSPH